MHVLKWSLAPDPVKKPSHAAATNADQDRLIPFVRGAPPKIHRRIQQARREPLWRPSLSGEIARTEPARKSGNGRRADAEPPPSIAILKPRSRHQRQSKPYDNTTPSICHGFAGYSGGTPPLQWRLAVTGPNLSESSPKETGRGSIPEPLEG